MENGDRWILPYVPKLPLRIDFTPAIFVSQCGANLVWDLIAVRLLSYDTKNDSGGYNCQIKGESTNGGGSAMQAMGFSILVHVLDDLAAKE